MVVSDVAGDSIDEPVGDRGLGHERPRLDTRGRDQRDAVVLAADILDASVIEASTYQIGSLCI